MADRRYNLKVTGLNELLRSIRRVSTEFPKEMRSINAKVAEPVARAATGKVPRRSGVLAGTIRGYATQRAAEVGAGRGIRYAGPIHYGWRAHNIEPQPFLVDAIHETADKTLDIWYREVDAFLDKVWVSIP